MKVDESWICLMDFNGFLVFKMGLNSVRSVFTELRSCLSFYRHHIQQPTTNNDKQCKPGQSVVEAKPALGANVGGGAILSASPIFRMVM